MTKKETLDLLRLLSSIESAILVSKVNLPDYLMERLEMLSSMLEAELLEGEK